MTTLQRTDIIKTLAVAINLQFSKQRCYHIYTHWSHQATCKIIYLIKSHIIQAECYPENQYVSVGPFWNQFPGSNKQWHLMDVYHLLLVVVIGNSE